MPLVLLEHTEHDFSFGIWHITESPQDLAGMLILDQDEQKQLDSFKKSSRQQQWLSYRVLTKKILGLTRQITISYDHHGKPHMIDPRHYMSVSHSASYAASIISKQFHVGIDIEVIHPKIDKITDKFLTEEELSNLENSPVEKAFVYWCAKEALFKLIGRRQVSMTENIFISPFEYNESGNFIGTISETHLSKSFKMTYRKINHLMLVYVAGTL